MYINESNARPYLNISSASLQLTKHTTRMRPNGMDIKPDNIFKSIPENLDNEVFDLLIQNENVKIERIVSKGHTSPTSGWYDQEQDEWLVILKGEAIILFIDGTEFNLTVGSYLNIPAQMKHKVKWTDPDAETIRLAIHY